MRAVDLRWLILFILISLTLVLVDTGGYLELPKAVVEAGIAPAEKVVFGFRATLGETFSLVRFWRSGEARIKNLEQRNLEQVSKVSRLEQLEKENGELRKQLGVGSLTKAKQLPANVLGESRFMTIDVGKNDGVKNGDVVVYLDNYIGRVVKNGAHLSFVQLATDSESKIPVRVGATSDVKGIVLGQFNSSVILDQVAQNEKLNLGDVIITAGEEENFRSGLIVGKVEKLLSKETDIFKKAEIKTLVDFRILRTVYVLID